MPGHIAEGVPATEGSFVKLDNVECKKMDVQSAGIKSFGKIGSQQDVDVETLGKGFVERSPNGHRWRILISDTGVISGVDLDA